eukprot:1196364-Prorocentrum_minimum.AAC.3
MGPCSNAKYFEWAVGTLRWGFAYAPNGGDVVHVAVFIRREHVLCAQTLGQVSTVLSNCRTVYVSVYIRGPACPRIPLRILSSGVGVVEKQYSADLDHSIKINIKKHAVTVTALGTTLCKVGATAATEHKKAELHQPPSYMLHLPSSAILRSEI